MAEEYSSSRGVLRPAHTHAQLVASSLDDTTAIISHDSICLQRRDRALCLTGTSEPVAAAVALLHENAANGAVLLGETYGRKIVPDVMAVASIVAVAAKYLDNLSKQLRVEAGRTKSRDKDTAEKLEALAEVSCHIGNNLLSSIGLLVDYQRVLLEILGYDYYYSSVTGHRYSVDTLRQLADHVKHSLETTVAREGWRQ